MLKLVPLLEQHTDWQLPTVVIWATSWWETTLAHVKLMEYGLGVHLPANVCHVCIYTLHSRPSIIYLSIYLAKLTHTLYIFM